MTVWLSEYIDEIKRKRCEKEIIEADIEKSNKNVRKLKDEIDDIIATAIFETGILKNVKWRYSYGGGRDNVIIRSKEEESDEIRELLGEDHKIWKNINLDDGEEDFILFVFSSGYSIVMQPSNLLKCLEKLDIDVDFTSAFESLENIKVEVEYIEDVIRKFTLAKAAKYIREKAGES